MDFSKAELERYSRQILYFGKAGQSKLKKARVTVVGAGGIGSPLLMSLASAGIGHIHILDHDRVDRSNLSRQTLFREVDIGFNKAATAANQLHELNPHIQLTFEQIKLHSGNAEGYLAGSDLCIEGSDDISAKFLISDMAVKTQKPALISGIGSDQGHIFPCWPQKACYRCYFGSPPELGILPSCASAGVLSPLPHIFGAQLAYLTIHFLVSEKKPQTMYLVDKLRWRNIPLRQNSECSVCFPA